MPELPERKQFDSTTEDELQRLLDLIPHIASYVAACVSKGGKDAVVRINISGAHEVRRWGMDIVIPGELLQKFEHLSGDNIPRAETVLQMISPQKRIEDGIIIAQTEAKAENEVEPWRQLNEGGDFPDCKEWYGDLPHGC